MKVAIVGRRNVGKSTLVNTLAQAERMIVSEVPGTTRDSVDVRFELDGKAFVAIDTPGFRRSKSINTDVDFYSTHRAQRSIRRADVVLLFFDATQRISQVDKQLCDYIAQQYKPCMFVVNKWDMIAGTMPTEKWVTYLRDQFRSLWYAPIAFITGQTGKNVKAMLNHSQMLFRQSLHRVPTAPIEQAASGGALTKTRRRSIRTAARRSSTPRRWPFSRPRSSCSATIRRRFLRNTSAICCGCSASRWISARCRSSSTSAAASTTTNAARATPKWVRMTIRRESSRRTKFLPRPAATVVESHPRLITQPSEARVVGQDMPWRDSSSVLRPPRERLPPFFVLSPPRIFSVFPTPLHLNREKQAVFAAFKSLRDMGLSCAVVLFSRTDAGKKCGGRFSQVSTGQGFWEQVAGRCFFPGQQWM